MVLGDDFKAFHHNALPVHPLLPTRYGHVEIINQELEPQPCCCAFYDCVINSTVSLEMTRVREADVVIQLSPHVGTYWYYNSLLGRPEGTETLAHQSQGLQRYTWYWTGRENQPVIEHSSNICAHLCTSNTGSLADNPDSFSPGSLVTVGDS